MNIQRITAILNSPVLTLSSRSARRLDWKEVVANSGLSGETRDLIIQVVKRTRLWSSEKYDVAEELVSHFVEGRELGKSEAELIEHFGSPAGTAGLIRRSKKKNRPFLWHVMVGARTCLIALLMTYSAALVIAMSRKPTVTVDYRALIEKETTNLPEDQTAWPVYREILTRFDIESFRLRNPEAEYWNDTVNQFQSDYKGVIPLLHQVGRFKSSGLKFKLINEFEKDDLMIFNDWNEHKAQIFIEYMNMVPENQILLAGQDLQKLMTAITPIEKNPDHLNLFPSPIWSTGLKIRPQWKLSQLLFVDSMICLDNSDYTRIKENIKTMFSLSSHANELRRLYDQLIVISINSHAQHTTRRALQHVNFPEDPDFMKEMIATFTRNDHLCIFDFHNETYIIEDLIQKTFSDNGNGNGSITLEGIKILESSGLFPQEESDNLYTNNFKLTSLPILQASSPDRKQITRDVKGFFNFLESSCRLQLWELKEVINKSNLTTGPDEPAKIDGINYDFGQFLYFIKGIFPNVPLKAAFHRANHENTKLILAVHGYYAEHGRWPEQLNDLVPGWLSEVPLDASSGKPLIYRIEKGKPLIYGRGYDGVDDGGQFDLPDKPGFHWSQGPTDEGDWLIWPVPIQHSNLQETKVN